MRQRGNQQQSVQLELAKRHPDRRVEVCNKGVSGYSLSSYLGVLEDSLARKPDVFDPSLVRGYRAAASHQMLEH